MTSRCASTALLLLSFVTVGGACGDDAGTGATGGGGSGDGGNAGPGGSTDGGADEGGGGAQTEGGGGATGGSFEGVDPIEGIEPVELVQGGYQFTEGPVWLAALGVLRFSDIPPADILELDVASDEITNWRPDSAQTNGNAVAPNGDILMCEHAGRRVSRSPAAGVPAPVTVADTFEDNQFNSPNDVIVRSDGTVYFTDPTYGLQGQQEIPFQGVFRVNPGGDVSVVDDTFEQPNGIALSPDEASLYVSDSSAGGLYRYDVAPDGSTSGGTLHIDAAPSDGMAVDDAGNLYLTTGAGVEVYAADGTPWGVIQVPEQPANCTFGGADRRTLFITARTGLYRVVLNVPGKP